MNDGRHATVHALGVVCLLAVTLAAAVVPGTAAGAGLGTGNGVAFARQSFDADGVNMRADLRANGSAAWTVQYRFELATRNESEAFDALSRDVRRNESAYVERFATRLRTMARSARNATGREMHIESVHVSTSRQQLGSEYGYGFVTYRFRWTGFAAVDGDRLVVGDALAGFYLDSDTSLAFGWPSEYAVASVSPAPTNRNDGALTWQGRLDFGPNEPRLVVAPAGSGGPSPLLVGVGALAALALLGVVGVLLRRRSGDAPTEPSATDDGDGGSRAPDATDDGTGSGGAAAGGDDAEPPEELLSNEERVLRLLERHGGRAKQQVVVEELDWTAAKTSQVVTGMREVGTVEVFRLGRENVVRLPDASREPDETDGEAESE